MSTTSTVATTATQQQPKMVHYCIDSVFKVPTDIKNDIIYCQRALKSHITVHQILLEKLNPLGNNFSMERSRIAEDLETEIYEINAEQNFLFMRLRRIIDDFHKSLIKKGVAVDTNATNTIVSKEVLPYIDDATIEIWPQAVQARQLENVLMAKYFAMADALVQSSKLVYEIVDSDDDEPQQQLIIVEKPTVRTRSGARAEAAAIKTDSRSDNAQLNGGSATKYGSGSLSQMSLLKPIAQRLVGNNGAIDSGDSPSGVALETPKPNILQSSHRPSQEAVVSTPAVVASCDDAKNLPVSTNVKMSRLNLRQALKKARTETLAASAAGKAFPMPLLGIAPTATLLPVATALPLSVTPSVNVKSQKDPAPVQPPPPPATRRGEVKTRAARNAAAAAAAAAAAKVAELQSSSEESSVERESSPQHALWPPEPEETRTQPQEYGQEMFLRLFQLFTPEMHIQMQQRRSKRKRRTVHSNERADFHYGRIEYGSYPPPQDHKKKRKAFLLSPQVKRGLQSKRPKRSSSEKNEEASQTSRSSSSSPDEKRGCNECLKGGGCLDQCNECKGHYHQTCHREDDEILIAYAREATQGSKLCPACKRVQEKNFKKAEKALQYETLHSTAKELQVKLAREEDRRMNLQQESKMYKIKMHNLLNIVQTIKSDQENDSSE